MTNKLLQLLIIRSVLVAVFLGFGGVILYYVNSSFEEVALEKRALTLRQEHIKVIAQFESSLSNFATIVSGIKSYVESVDSLPNERQLQKFVNGQLEYSNYRKDFVISFIDSSHTFKYVFTKESFDPGKLVGTSVRDLRDDDIIQELDEMLGSNEIKTFSPLNLKEGWLGIPFDFRVVKDGEVIGYIACILNLEIALDEIYSNFNSQDYLLRFSANENIDFDRTAIYNGSISYNEKVDIENYKNFEVPTEEFENQFLDLYGQKIRIGIAFKESVLGISSYTWLILAWYLTLIIMVIIGLNQWLYVKKLNRKLNKNMAIMEKISKLFPAHVYILDLTEKKNIYENRNIAEFLDFEKGKIITSNELMDVYRHVDGQSSVEAIYANYSKMKQGVIYDSTAKYINKFGQWKSFHCKELIFKTNENGTPKQILGVTEDITQIKKIELELAESEKKLTAAQEISKIGHWEINILSGKSVVSDELANVLDLISDFEKEELRQNANYFLKFVHEADAEMVKNKFNAGLQTGKKYAVDYRIISCTKTLKHVHSIVNFVMDEDMNPVKIWGTIQDITSRKLIEQQLQNQCNDLEIMNTELDRFVFSVTHDLKAPLANMLGIISLTKSDGDKHNLEEYSPMIEKSINKMKEFIDDLIIYARNVHAEVKVENIDLKSLIINVIAEHKYMNGADKIQFEVDIAEKHKIVSDPSRVRIIFNNLISNSIKYHDYSKKNLFVKVHASVYNDETIVSLCDNGIGMNNEESEKIFGMFYRANNTDSKVNGSGIGLFILNTALKKIGGKISVKTALEKGTTFTVNLPNNCVT